MALTNYKLVHRGIAAFLRSYSQNRTILDRFIFSSFTSFGLIVILCGMNSIVGNIAFGQNLATKNLREGFESEGPKWQTVSQSLQNVVKVHSLVDLGAHAGRSCEQWLFQSPRVLLDSKIKISVPPARVFNELKTSVWVRTDCRNVRFVAKVKFPHQHDPRTSQTLEVEVPGTIYSKYGQWQELTCELSDTAMRRRLVMVRGQLAGTSAAGEIDSRECYVDELKLIFDVSAGGSVLQIDDLNYGPIVQPKTLITSDPLAAAPRSRLHIDDDRVIKDGKPFFPVFTLYHGESLRDVASTGVNMVWIEDFTDKPLLEAIEQSGLGVLAKPPQPSVEQAIEHDQSISSFEDWSRPVWAWILGFEIPADDVRYVSGWVDQIRDADRRFRRPILADVKGQQRAFHRQVDFVSSSRLTTNQNVGVNEHAANLDLTRNAALPGKPMFTFVQTEASAEWVDHRQKDQPIPIIEPEQILHQAYAAIAAGYKGIGFWKQIPFDEKITGLDERIHAIRLFALHAKILEPFLATGRVVDEILVRRDSSFPKQAVGVVAPLRTRWDQPIEQTGLTTQTPQRDIRASVLKSDDGWLILPVWYEDNEQFVPGRQAVQGIRMLLRADVTQAWEVTPTGISQANLELSRVPGGTEIHLRQFDQQTAIVISSKPHVIDQINQVCRQVRDQSALSMVELAKRKFLRVQNVHAELSSLTSLPPSLEAEMKSAFMHLGRAQKELDSGHPIDAYRHAEQSLQNLRSVQRNDWEQTVSTLNNSMTSLDATSFQTLPDHWRLIQQFQQNSKQAKNLLPDGNFQNEQAILTQWKEVESPNSRNRVQLQVEPSTANKYLTMQLESQSESTASYALTGPELKVGPNQILIVSAKIKYTPIAGRTDNEFLFYDSLFGSYGAIRFREPQSTWRTVEFIRKITEPIDYRVRLELRGTGKVEVDDVTIHQIPMTTPITYEPRP